MPAGMNLTVRIIRLVYSQDDDIGGAAPSGTFLPENIQARITSDLPMSETLGQGLETIRTFSAMFWYPNLQMREQDEIEVTSPPNHPYYGHRFRVMALKNDSNHPSQKRDYWLAVLTRSVRAHRDEFQ